MTPVQTSSPPRKRVEVVDYDPDWPRQFAVLSAVLWPTLEGAALRIEHVGSTSVPGLAAKPILDIDVVIASPDKLPLVTERLARLGYTHRGDLGIAEREAFGRAGTDVPRDGSGREWFPHHLYVCSQNSRELVRHLAFRDYLRAHPDAAHEYGALKHALSLRHAQDIDAYIDGKTPFIESVYEKTGHAANKEKTG